MRGLATLLVLLALPVAGCTSPSTPAPDAGRDATPEGPRTDLATEEDATTPVDNGTAGPEDDTAGNATEPPATDPNAQDGPDTDGDDPYRIAGGMVVGAEQVAFELAVAYRTIAIGIEPLAAPSTPWTLVVRDPEQVETWTGDPHGHAPWCDWIVYHHDPPPLGTWTMDFASGGNAAGIRWIVLGFQAAPDPEDGAYACEDVDAS